MSFDQEYTDLFPSGICNSFSFRAFGPSGNKQFQIPSENKLQILTSLAINKWNYLLRVFNTMSLLSEGFSLKANKIIALKTQGK